MGVIRRRGHWRQLWLSFATVTALLCLLSASATSAARLSPTQPQSKKLEIEGKKARQQLKGLTHGSSWNPVESTQNGLGSWPPRCIKKCGKCRPCKPVHVSVHPGSIMPLEYYPEAWRCECGGKLFNP